MIVIVDYGMGNLRSVEKGFERFGFDVKVTDDPREVKNADKLVLPGVGAFRDAMDGLRQRGLIEPIVDYIQSGKPFLGICLGLQLLFSKGYEDGEHDGLGVIPGKVVRFKFSENGTKEKLKIPHMGWNQISFLKEDNPLLEKYPVMHICILCILIMSVRRINASLLQKRITVCVLPLWFGIRTSSQRNFILKKASNTV